MDRLTDFRMSQNISEKGSVFLFDSAENLIDFFGGNILKGRVIKTDGDNAILKFPRKEIPVKLLAPLKSGQSVRVKLVKISSGELTLQLVPKKAKSKVYSLKNNSEDLLKSLNIKVTEVSLELIKRAITYKFPLERDFFLKGISILKNFDVNLSESDIDLIFFMRLNNIPLTGEVFQSLKDILRKSYLIEKTDEYRKKLNVLIQNISVEPKIREKAEEILKFLEDSYLKPYSNNLEGNLKSLIKTFYKPLESQIFSILRELEYSANYNAVAKDSNKNTKSVLLKPNIDILDKTSLLGYTNNLDFIKCNLNKYKVEKIEGLKNSFVFKLKELLHSLLINIKGLEKKEKYINFIKDKINGTKNIASPFSNKDIFFREANFIEKMIDLKGFLREKIDLNEVSDLKEVLRLHEKSYIEQFEGSKELANVLKSILKNLDLLQMTLKNRVTFDDIPYFSLPLPLLIQGYLKRGEMRIYNERTENGKISNKEIKVEIFLETLNLGNVLIEINRRNNLSELKFTVAKEHIKRFFETNLDYLRDLFKGDLRTGSIICCVGRADFPAFLSFPEPEEKLNMKTIDARI